MAVPHRTGRLHLTCVTVSMRVMSAGDGYKYLLRTVAAADGDRSLSTPFSLWLRPDVVASNPTRGIRHSSTHIFSPRFVL